ncbi:MAG: hypothetical protein QW543_01235 [Sulfolobales archaeon]
MLVVIATSTLDYVAGKARLGGPAYYIGLTLSHLDSRTLLVTTRSSVSRYLSRLTRYFDVVEAGSGETVFEIELHESGNRSLRVLRRSFLEVETLAKVLVDRSLVLISTTYGELDPRHLVELTRGRNVVVDIQGFVRRVSGDGRVVHDTQKVFEVGKYLEASKWSILRGEREEFPKECWVSPLECAERLRSDIVITDGEKPFKVLSRRDECLYEITPLQGFHGESIGLGDVFTAVLTYYLFIEGSEFLDAATVASVAAALKLRGRLPWFTVQELDVLKRKVSINRSTCRRAP